VVVRRHLVVSCGFHEFFIEIPRSWGSFSLIRSIEDSDLGTIYFVMDGTLECPIPENLGYSGNTTGPEYWQYQSPMLNPSREFDHVTFLALDSYSLCNTPMQPSQYQPESTPTSEPSYDDIEGEDSVKTIFDLSPYVSLTMTVCGKRFSKASFLRHEKDSIAE
jgi:hypothetical protein